MDVTTFARDLSSLYEEWETPRVRPRSGLFGQLLRDVPGMTTPNVLQLLNFAVRCLGPGEVYCEVGSYRGATLVGALIGQANGRAVAVDNFSEFDPVGDNQTALATNLARYGLDDMVRFVCRDFEDYLVTERAALPPVGVYFYDGAHDYRSQLLGLLLAAPALADTALVVVDDANLSDVRAANRDFLAARPEARLLLDLPTPENGHPTFWNGLTVMTWDRLRSGGARRTEAEVGTGWPHR